MDDVSSNTVLAIDAGGTFFKSALIDASGESLPGSFCHVPANSNGAKDEILAAYQSILQCGTEYACNCGRKICGIGISTPGPFDYDAGTSLMKHKFQAIYAVPLRDEFRRFGFFPDDAPIRFMHDVHALLFGEQWNGAIKGVANAAAVTLGTGLGFGMMKGGRICDNGKGGPAVSLFSRPYKNGILEDAVSRRGIVNRYKRYAAKSDADVDVHNIAELAVSGDAAALRIFEETGEILADKLVVVLIENHVDAVVFGGQISKSFDLFGPAFKRRLSENAKAVSAMAASDVDFSALKGAARMVIQPERA